mgnify:FL=1
MLKKNSSLVLFSGGQDSTICLLWALSEYEEVYTIGFEYGQRHKIEIECRNKILLKLKSFSKEFSSKIKEDTVITLDGFKDIVKNSSLLNEKDISDSKDDMPDTFVPGRNLIFLNYAGIVAYNHDILDIIGGMCQTDYSGYPDCRKETILSMEKTLNLGMEKEFNLITPLMDINKSETWQIAYSLYGFNILEIIIEESHTCYMGDRENRHIWGYGCDNCPACALRKKGWLAFLANNLELKERYNVRG